MRWVLVVFLVSTAVPQLARYSAHIAARAMLEASEAEGAGDGHLTLTLTRTLTLTLTLTRAAMCAE